MEWAEGMACQVAEYDEAAGRPKPGGTAFPAVVEYTDRHGFVFADIPGLGRSIAFRAGTGLAFGSNSGWCLMPAGEAAAAAGEGTP